MEKEINDAFRSQATKRTNAVIDRIRILTQCSNRNAFQFNNDEVEEMFDAIETELKIAKSRFTSRFSFS
ncbi:MAG: hypothetical protein CL780_00745 [Chloroflexi bacterium]|nr:hypothetical protein [Chloroflexota bacterium]|tara:strand:- start:507 stop:713 length:207 start_codon:yes stop_codon:yes gene_type:complete